MTTRRLLLSILAGGCATVLPSGVSWTAPEIGSSLPRWVPATDPRPRPEHYQMRRMALPDELGPAAYPRGQTFGNRWISTGEVFVEVGSPEGEAIALERAVNLRSDGTIRHRQHHWPRN